MTNLTRRIRMLSPARDCRGNVSLLFALSLPVLLLGIGIAIVVGKAASIRTKLNAAADAAALNALTPAMMQASPEAAKAAAVKFFNGQIASISGLVPGATAVTVTITVPASNPMMRQVNVAYSAESKNFFGALEPSSTFGLGGSASAEASTPPNVDFYILLDNSPSMQLPSTSAGVLRMQALTPDQGSCALACHQASTNNSETAGNPCLKGTTYSTPTLLNPPPATQSARSCRP